MSGGEYRPNNSSSMLGGLISGDSFPDLSIVNNELRKNVVGNGHNLMYSPGISVRTPEIRNGNVTA
jgi:hypothetical protein